MIREEALAAELEKRRGTERLEEGVIGSTEELVEKVYKLNKKLTEEENGYINQAYG